MVSQPNSLMSERGPVRTCIGCRARAAKRELLRVVAGTDADGHWFVSPDPTGSAAGRGAHLHPTYQRLALAERKRAFARALRHDAGQRGALSLERLLAHLADAKTARDPKSTAPI